MKRISKQLWVGMMAGWLMLGSVRAEPTPRIALLVLNKGDTSLVTIDPDTLKVIAKAPAGANPHEVIATPDGKLAFISNYGKGHTLSVVDLVGQKALPAVELSPLSAPHGLALAEGKIYFTCEANKVIGRCDPTTRKVDWILGLGQDRTHMLLVNKTATEIYTSDVDSDTVTVIEKKAAEGNPQSPTTNWEETHITVGDGPEGFDVSPDGKELWAANSHDGTVSIVDVAKRAVVETLKTGTGYANRLKFTPDGTRVLISDLRGDDLLVYDTATRKELKRIAMGGRSAGILMQPDGVRAFVAVGSRNGIVVIDLKKLEATALIASGREPDGMAWAERKE